MQNPMPDNSPDNERFTIPVRLAASPYDVIIGGGLAGECGPLIAEKVGRRKKCALITDNRVGPLYAEKVAESLRAAGLETSLHEVPSGENSKCMSCAERLCECLIRSGHDRSSFVVSLGGGVVGDLAGFVASIYFRGIPYVQMPTTIVAQVDSSVGGKTGVNAVGGKNLIGSFHQPLLVLADPLLLNSLPDREFYEGFAEIVKHAVIRDAEMLGQIRPEQRTGLAPLIARNVAIKAEIVAGDEKETLGLRALLNFGHTLGHAIENAAGYGEFLHGEAISLGIVAALRLSKLHAGLPGADETRVVNLLRALRLPVDWSRVPPKGKVLAAMKTDKKFEGGNIRFVLTSAPGSAFVSDKITLRDIEALWNPRD